MSTNQTYVLHFTNPARPPIVIPVLRTDGTIGPTSATLFPDSTYANTSLLFFGKGHIDYGERVQENLVNLLENFAGIIPPVHPIPGQLWYDTSVHYFKAWNGSTWGAAIGTGAFVMKSGDSMTGNLSMNNGSRVVQGAAPVGSSDLVNKLYVDQKVSKLGDSMVGNLSFPTGTKVTLTDLPSIGTDAANKTYVDSVLGSSAPIFIKTNTDSVPLVIGMPVFLTGIGNGVHRARANTGSTSIVAGLCNLTSVATNQAVHVQTDGQLTATTAQWNILTGQVSGLTEGATYYLSISTPGQITPNISTTAGTYVCPIGIALSTTSMLIRVQPIIGL